MQLAVDILMSMGKFPREMDSSEEDILAWEVTIKSIKTPVTDAEAGALVTLLEGGNSNSDEDLDSCFGLKWMLMNIILTAPSRSYLPADISTAGYWIQKLADTD